MAWGTPLKTKLDRQTFGVGIGGTIATALVRVSGYADCFASAMGEWVKWVASAEWPTARIAGPQTVVCLRSMVTVVEHSTVRVAF